MHLMDRRRFLITTVATAASLKTLAQPPAPPTPQGIPFTLHPDQPGPVIPLNFVGLSYETQQLSDPTFFSPANTSLIERFRELAPHGVLRIGGNTSDVGWWKPTPTSEMPPLPGNVVLTNPPGERPPLDLAYAITPDAVTNLRGFLDATGWTCLYGINLATNTPVLAAQQAVFVAKTLGTKLEYFQIGNEPDGFARHFREKDKWNADAYLDDWLAVVNAIRVLVPDARFGLPDVASNVGWCAPIADRLKTMKDSPAIAAVTHHHYFTGPPSNPKANITDLLKPDPRVPHDAELVRAAAIKLHTSWRMTEGNTCYRGGKPGLSDVFASALWAADYLLTLASLGYAGVNLHGGDGPMVANSLGGKLPGDDLVHDDPATHPHPYYTPIAHIGTKYIPEPIYYGMQFAQQFAGATVIPIDFNPGPVNATAFAAKHPDGRFILAIINKDATQELNLQLPSIAGIWDTVYADSLESAIVRLVHTSPSLLRKARIGPHSMLLLTDFKPA